MAYKTIYPYTGEVLKEYANHTEEDLERALATGHALYKKWREENSLDSRKAQLHQVANLLRRDADKYAKILTHDMGKLIDEAKFEVLLCADIADYFADKADEFLKPEIFPTAAGEAYCVRQAIGIVFAVEPWNFPFYQVMRVFAPNFIVGNPIILKHASNCPGSAEAFDNLCKEAGCEEGAFKNLFLSYGLVAKAIADPRVQGACLTGSERGGSSIAEAAGKNLKKSSLELGGNDAFIVLDDADMDEVKSLLFPARLYNAGQVCVSSKRFIVTEKNYDRFVADLKEEFAKAKWGDPMDPATNLAPLSSATAKQDVLQAVKEAVDDGAECIFGNEPIDLPGYFVMPTILVNVTKENSLYNREIFGPVGVVYKVKDEDEAVALANDSSYGLGNSIFSADLKHACEVGEKIETGMSCINAVFTTLPELPFGGVKNSGYGRELSRLGFNAFVNEHLIYTSKETIARHK